MRCPVCLEVDCQMSCLPGGGWGGEMSCLSGWGGGGR